MDDTPADVKLADNSLDTRISDHKEELVQVQKLFYERRHKQCIARCEQLQRSELHVLIQAFLWYYCAISYESIGLLAHNFSQNKLQFLESARESLSSAAKFLPLPYVSTEVGSYEQQEESPLSPDFGFPSLFADKIQAANDRTSPVTPRVKEISPSSSTGSFYSTVSPCKAAPILFPNEASPQKEADHQEPALYGSNIEAEQEEEEPSTPNHFTVPVNPATHRTRLSRVLSSPQALQQELIPSPLFSRASKQACLPHPFGMDAIVPRPLPPLPFKQNPNFFRIEGTRITQRQSHLRKTAVQTLIARFEGTLPLAPISASVHSLTPITPGISTPRFHMIRDAFSPDPRNEHLEAYLSATASAALTRYNMHLADFHTQLRKHIAYIDGEITRVQQLQFQRSAVKLLGPKQRLASFWSFDAAKSPCPNRPRSANDNIDHDGKDEEDQLDATQAIKAKAKRERIEQLRRQGWRVTKEKHGFKGVEFYDRLAQQVELELQFA